MAKKTKAKKAKRSTAKPVKKASSKKPQKAVNKIKSRGTAKKNAIRKKTSRKSPVGKQKVQVPTVDQLVHSGEPLFVKPLDQV